jgi:tetratricopeptide (TPR) repeat protein
LNPSERIQYLEQLLQNDPNDSFLSYALALEYQKLGDVCEAINLLEALRSDDPGYSPTYYQLGAMYIEQNEPDKAKPIIEAGMALVKAIDLKTYNELRSLLDEVDSI